jgi:predicted small metal-binding protein
MAVMLRCADGGATDCPFEVKTENESELLEHVKLHISSSHPDLAKNPPPAEKLKSMIRTV